MAYITKEKVAELKATNDLKLMKKYCDEDKTNGFIHLEYAKMLIVNGMFGEAKEELKPLLTTNKEYSARYELGRIALLTKNYDLARDHFHYVEDNTNYQYEREKARFEIARLEYECKKLNQSKIYFEKLLETKFDENAKLNLGKIDYQLQEYEESKMYLKSLLDTKFDYVARHELGKTEYALGNIDAARYYFQTSIEQGNEYSFYELGKLEFSNHNYKEAEINFEKSKYASIYLPKTKYLLGKKEEAIAEFKTLLNTKDGLQSRLHLSMIYIKDNNYEKAFDIMKDAMGSYYSADDGTKLKVALVLFKELGVFFYRDYPKFEELTYSDRQIVMYDETSALSHIIANHTNHISKNNFNEDLNIFDLFNTVKDKLSEENSTPVLTFTNMYHINYPNVGSEGESILRIITLPGTKDIITMYPVFAKRDNLDEAEEENTNYALKSSMLLKKLSTLYELSQNSDFDLSDVFSDSEKELISEMFDLKNSKSKSLTK